MARRKRLTPANPAFLSEEPPAGAASAFARPAPIATVARDASSAAAMDELAETLSKARAEGRLVLALPLAEIETGYLVRDRLKADDEEMRVLKESLRARGQQTPVEVTELGQGRYGLISGWRRCRALVELAAETGEARFGSVLALVRRPAEASDAYLAMVEENEIRVGLSYYERARIAFKAVEAGVFETRQDALRALFHTASRPRRSKIGSFLGIVEALDGVLAFPETIGERQGLALAKALEADPALGARLADILHATPPENAEAEAAIIAQALAGPAVPKESARPTGEELVPGVFLRRRGDALTLSGPGLTDTLQADLAAWLKARG
ncbi:ParB/RepB/Spo0J family partition protein [Roseivivax isoporae]|uniref:ParB-like N-terminal domain-containing protein n=1 Tax=Roseivivax isoporae LMG 25204 TaxID=1449351 RepID=X7F4L5_9RHOB|nr:ParB N-terminal domain-containing protein [Roseivivax isoporae]ETX26999.1 hypothetical protein RISW2_17190 [Roseivivax isoporae LMG 25204]